MLGIKHAVAVAVASAVIVTGGTTYAIAGSGPAPTTNVVTFSYVPRYAADYAKLTSFVTAHCMDWKNDAKNVADYAKLESKLDAKLSASQYYIAGQNGQLEPMTAPSYSQLTNALPACPKG